MIIIHKHIYIKVGIGVWSMFHIGSMVYKWEQLSPMIWGDLLGETKNKVMRGYAQSE